MDFAAEVERLHALLDKVPSCLMRVAHDGTLLAVSDAALTLLGAEALADVLDTNFVERLDANAIHTEWAEFVDRVLHGGSASMACDMIQAGGEARAVLLLGTTMPPHPDDVASILVVVRDVSVARRLEESLHEQTELRESAQEGLENATASLDELRGKLAQVEQRCQQLGNALSLEQARRQEIGLTLDDLTRVLESALTATSHVRRAIGTENEHA